LAVYFVIVVIYAFSFRALSVYLLENILSSISNELYICVKAMYAQQVYGITVLALALLYSKYCCMELYGVLLL